jgi:energy-coupling factor transporter ATP-binding protein EcfA2
VDRAFRDELVERLRLDPSQRARSYSKGNRQKVALIAALMPRADVLLLDEPISGLDPLMEAEFQAITREAVTRGQTVFLSSHILDEAQDVCDRVGILRAGRLVEVASLEDLRRLNTTVFEVRGDLGRGGRVRLRDRHRAEDRGRLPGRRPELPADAGAARGGRLEDHPEPGRRDGHHPGPRGRAVRLLAAGGGPDRGVLGGAPRTCSPARSPGGAGWAATRRWRCSAG